MQIAETDRQTDRQTDGQMDRYTQVYMDALELTILELKTESSLSIQEMWGYHRYRPSLMEHRTGNWGHCGVCR